MKLEFPIHFHDIVLRPELKEDYQKMKIFNDLLIDEKALIGRKEKRTEEEWKRNIEYAVNEMFMQKAVLIIAEKDEKIIGRAGIFQEQQKMDHFGNFGIMIDKNFRGIGLGKKISQIIIPWAIETISGLKFLELGVTENNFHAQRLYQSLGFHTVAVLPKKMNHFGTFLDEYIMHLNIVDFH